MPRLALYLGVTPLSLQSLRGALAHTLTELWAWNGCAQATLSRLAHGRLLIALALVAWELFIWEQMELALPQLKLFVTFS